MKARALSLLAIVAATACSRTPSDDAFASVTAGPGETAEVRLVAPFEVELTVNKGRTEKYERVPDRILEA